MIRYGIWLRIEGVFTLWDFLKIYKPDQKTGRYSWKDDGKR
jgi:hypothetical protein